MTDIKIKFNPSLERVGAAFSAIQLGARVQQKLEQFAFRTEAESKVVTPVDTGRLRASIGTDIGNLEAKIAPHTDYAGFVHWGTSRVRGRPFMLWGLQAASKEFSEDEFARYLDKEISDKLSQI